MRRTDAFQVGTAIVTALFLCGCHGPNLELAGKPLAEWTRQLDSAERQDRLSAVRAVGELARRHADDAAAVRSLRAALRHDDRAVRHWAVRSVNTLGETAADFEGDLRERLSDDIADVRIWAGYGLCRLGKTEEGLPVLAAALSDTNGGARLHAAHALEALGEDARPLAAALRGVLGDEFGYPDRVAGRVLKNLGEYPPDAAQD
ncbi:MAG: HEAT repeat domain-containing protein [Acidobacteria bacterium]|nr:HEAT repeat domain-containing protein [Acidobacteriota bacterium]